MLNPIQHLNKAFENKVRLGIMSLLMIHEELEFTRIKELLQLTDGNLASHSRALESAGYVEVEKSFVGRKPNTLYRATKAGRSAFQQHLDALEVLIRQGRD
ncbi:winged helix-turn-helix domain-containing protein [Cesiribacter andamanensis]|uniref:Helix-turn-helix domain protein n=1 Tax=Cesiribacter andamanensis AMV16 TaxID=1279009 RepID=M7MYB6_9BACT|nr:transcriptional regulator [Cesiribacter andamanensis]EMR01438.1 Helix-turn-helix domain protein [Cesiribacter andamanensis AMV16]